jgi:hypothetical protein
LSDQPPPWRKRPTPENREAILDAVFEPLRDDEGDCHRCNGEGRILVCIDDLCQGQGECIHGDGYAVCPVCKGVER